MATGASCSSCTTAGAETLRYRARSSGVISEASSAWTASSSRRTSLQNRDTDPDPPTNAAVGGGAGGGGAACGCASPHATAMQLSATTAIADRAHCALTDKDCPLHSFPCECRPALVWVCPSSGALSEALDGVDSSRDQRVDIVGLQRRAGSAVAPGMGACPRRQSSRSARGTRAGRRTRGAASRRRTRRRRQHLRIGQHHVLAHPQRLELGRRHRYAVAISMKVRNSRGMSGPIGA
jgi:hypothetical protein